MDRNSNSSIDPVDLLNEHYEAVEMPDDYRRTLLSSTRGAVAGRRRAPLLRWTLGLAGAAAVVALLALMLYQPQARTNTTPGAKHIAGVQKTPAPSKNGGVVRKNSNTDDIADSDVTTNPGRMHENGSKQVRHTGSVTQNQGMQQKVVYPPQKQESKFPVVAVVSIRQPVRDGAGRVLKAGDRLPVGTPIRTGDGGRVTLVTARGSELYLASGSELVFSAKNAATITRGRLYCANRNKEIAEIDTPAGHVKLLGTVVDTAVVDKDSVAVTVVEGKVQLSNKHGKALVDAGKKSMLVAFRSPQAGRAVNTRKETAWYQGRGDYQSDFGDVAYTVRRGDGLITEVWTMKADGDGRHRVKSYLGGIWDNGQWLPGEQWLTLETHSLVWTTPDVEERRAHSTSGHPIIRSRTWLLNAVSGQDMLLPLPKEYKPLYMSYSPNGESLAFNGSYMPEPDSLDGYEYGVWVYSTVTGKTTKLYDGGIKTPVSWAPDSRWVAVSSGESYTNDHSLMLIDTQTGQIRDLGIKGAGAVFSPDGTKLAYCGDFKSSGEWLYGVPTSGSIFVLDLKSGGEPVRVSPAGDDAVMPRWSPDGSRIAYRGSDQRICSVRVDGTDFGELYRAPEDFLLKASWAPGGDAVFVSVGVSNRQTLLVAADGSGVIKTLGQSDEDNKLPRQMQAQTDAAAAALQEAVFQFAMGKVHAFEADLSARRESYAAAADIFSRLVWDYPLSGLEPQDALSYADGAAREASRPDSEVLAESCDQRIRLLGYLIAAAAAKQGQLPRDISTLLDCLSSFSWNIDWLDSSDREHLMMLGWCPGTTDHAAAQFIYTPPADASDPKVGDVLLRCPQHPDVCYTWSENDSQRLNKSLMREGKLGAFCKLSHSFGNPYRFENVGDRPLTVTYHVMSDTYEIQGKARLLPTGRVYADESVSLGPLDSGSAARGIDSAGFVDWGNMPPDEVSRAQEELDFCRCVARYEAGLGVEDCKLLQNNPDYKVMDGEPARRLFNGPGRGIWSAPTLDRGQSACHFEPMGPGNTELYQLVPSGRFRVFGTVRVLNNDQTCTNGWIDKNGNVTYTE